jgi:hypothetical protein
MNVTNSPGRPPLSPQEGWISDGRQVLHCQPRGYRPLEPEPELMLEELIPREPARKLGAQKRRAGRPASMGIPVITACF